MKYRIVEIKEDKDILTMTGESIYAISKRIGVNQTYLGRLKNGQVIASEEYYKELKKKILDK
jgi:hypothetical protein